MVCRMVLKTLVPGLSRAVSTTVRMSASPPLPFRLKLWLASAFALADSVAHLAASTVAATPRALERRLGAVLAAPTTCDLAAALQAKLRRARDGVVQKLLGSGYRGRGKGRPVRAGFQLDRRLAGRRPASPDHARWG